MFGLIPFTFRFRGKVRRLFDIYQCFLANPGVGLHPSQISRHTGMGLQSAANFLDATPELFIRLPKRPDGLTRYRLTSLTVAKQPEEIQQFLVRSARMESLMLYAVGAMVLCGLLIVVILVGPAL